MSVPDDKPPTLTTEGAAFSVTVAPGGTRVGNFVLYPIEPERATGDHLGRTDKDFAIEFGGYLAKAAEHFQHVMQAELAGNHDQDAVNDAWNGLHSAIYEFRKRAGMLK